MIRYKNISRFSNASASNSAHQVMPDVPQQIVLEPEMTVQQSVLNQSFNYMEPEMILEQTHAQSALNTPIVGSLLFPFKTMPFNHPESFKNRSYEYYDYTATETNATTFGYRRGSNRIHAARDLYYDVGEPIYAITSGRVLRVSPFYWDTWVIEVEHDYEHVPGHKVVARYGEVNKNNILVSVGDSIARGQKIGEVGLLTKDGRFIRQPSPDKRGMLHFEMYTGEATGRLSTGWVSVNDMKYARSINYSSGRSFRRRIDLIDPLPLLQTMLSNSKASKIMR